MRNVTLFLILFIISFKSLAQEYKTKLINSYGKNRVSNSVLIPDSIISKNGFSGSVVQKKGQLLKFRVGERVFFAYSQNSEYSKIVVTIDLNQNRNFDDDNYFSFDESIWRDQAFTVRISNPLQSSTSKMDNMAIDLKLDLQGTFGINDRMYVGPYLVRRDYKFADFYMGSKKSKSN